MRDRNQSLVLTLVQVTILIVMTIIIAFWGAFWGFSEASRAAKYTAKNIVLNEGFHIKKGIDGYQRLRGEFCPSVELLYSNGFITKHIYSSLGLTRSLINYTTKKEGDSCIVDVPLPANEDLEPELNFVLSAIATISGTEYICSEVLSFGPGYCNDENSYEFSVKNRLKE